MKHRTQKTWIAPYARSQPDYSDKSGGCGSAAAKLIAFAILTAAVLAELAARITT